MVSWLSLESSVCTSVSLRCLSVEKGLLSKESKFGSPAPGTMKLLMPCECPDTLWFEQKKTSIKRLLYETWQVEGVYRMEYLIAVGY